jgi:hypothetical protein
MTAMPPPPPPPQPPPPLLPPLLLLLRQSSVIPPYRFLCFVNLKVYNLHGFDPFIPLANSLSFSRHRHI